MQLASEILDSHGEATAVARSSSLRLADFYELTKPRMNFLVVITTMVGFYMAAAAGQINWLLMLHTLVGTALTAASASALNQLIERRFDALMPRTRNRPLVTGRIAPSEAMLFGAALGIVGVAYLAILVNSITALLGAITLISYIAIYTPLKR